jgi:hypothetical protein
MSIEKKNTPFRTTGAASRLNSNIGRYIGPYSFLMGRNKGLGVFHSRRHAAFVENQFAANPPGSSSGRGIFASRQDAVVYFADHATYVNSGIAETQQNHRSAVAAKTEFLIFAKHAPPQLKCTFHLLLSRR